MAQTMGIIESIRLLFSHRKDDLIPLPAGYDSQIYSEVMMRIAAPEQQSKVMRAAFQLAQLWQYGDLAHIPRVMVMVEATYPHLERMADLEVYTTDWLSELTAAMQLTAEFTGNHDQLSEEIDRLLHDAEVLNKPG